MRGRKIKVGQKVKLIGTTRFGTITKMEKWYDQDSNKYITHFVWVKWDDSKDALDYTVIFAEKYFRLASVNKKEDDETWTEDASKLEREFAGIITPVIKKWAEKGYFYRDIEDIMTVIVEFTCASEKIRKFMEQKKNAEK